MNFFKKKKGTTTILKQTVTFWSPFSNGATTCAVQYAKALSEKYNVSVALLELDMLHPSFNRYYPEGPFGFREILRSDRMDRITFESIRNSAIQEGVDVYKNYFNYNELDSLNVELMEKILTMIQSMYEYIVIDTNRNFDDVLTDMAFRFSDRIFIPIKPEMEELMLLNEYLQLFEEHQEWSVLKCAAIVNQYEGHHPTYVDIEKTLKTAVVGWIKKSKNIDKDKESMSEMMKIIESEVKR